MNLLTAGKGKYVLGCGSNVVDYIYNVRGTHVCVHAVKINIYNLIMLFAVVPKAGEKGFFLRLI